MRSILFSSLLLVAACDTVPERLVARVRPTPTFKASCATPQLGTCIEYNEDSFTLGAELLRTACLESHGAWSPARCPTNGRVGTCLTSLSERRYYRGYTARTAAKDCAELLQGRWLAP